ncbi:peptide/nickel transport system permease protein [Neolewinella xylanilytica]|uniref:Peptide/nickel transport system permease protein n=1 Tax=Neolewinella xylanilytica TaxID=1514080 RepID=A0A2S6I423_9BACT|nr:ABC transporter permease [Neolewinella xylanilytica]PPK85926.1 peptide/nickel transport system permease protein [Neolewinella xylanilytica]
MLVINPITLPLPLQNKPLLTYALRKLLYLPFSLLLLSLVCFVLFRAMPSDPVSDRMSIEGIRPGVNDHVSYERTYRRLAARLGYDLPPFYVALGNAALPDTLHRIVPRSRRELVRNLAFRYGNWPRVQAYYREVLRASTAYQDEALVASARRLMLRSDPVRINRELNRIRELPAAAALLTAHRQMVGEANRSSLLFPRLTWHGTDNQYHRYLTGLLRGDLGVSYADGRPVAGKIAAALPGTAMLNGITLLLVYLLAVPLGLYMAYYRDTTFDRWSTLLTFLAFGLPAFWVATLLANFFTTPAFGMDWFPSMGYGRVPEGASWWTAMRIRAAHLFLPVVCLAYPSFAYVSRHLRSAALQELDKPYVRTAYMKGLTGGQVLWRHVFRNASFPLITMLGGLLPALLAGSVLIEQIFNLPGMGDLLYRSATARDWPVVISLVLINGLLTVVGLLLADIGYALLDPRVRLGKLPPR